MHKPPTANGCALSLPSSPACPGTYIHFRALPGFSISGISSSHIGMLLIRPPPPFQGRPFHSIGAEALGHQRLHILSLTVLRVCPLAFGLILVAPTTAPLHCSCAGALVAVARYSVATAVADLGEGPKVSDRPRVPLSTSSLDSLTRPTPPSWRVLLHRIRTASAPWQTPVVNHQCTIPRCTRPNNPQNPGKAYFQAHHLSSEVSFYGYQ